MLVRQTENTFIRIYDDKGYITNQMTRYDRVYNETGAEFLRVLSREPQDIDILLEELSEVFNGSVDEETLRKDFTKFIEDLEKCYFIVTGDSIEECNSKDIGFNYSADKIKTNIINYTQHTEQNIEETTFDYMIAADQRKPQLKSIQFELTSRCNERCIHCYIPNSKKNVGKDMTFERFREALDQFVEMGGIHVSLSGGEIFLHRDIIKIIQYCREKDLEICILSNLIALKDVHIPFLKKANLSYIQTSLYSMDPEIHDTITTIKGSHQKTLSALEKLIAADIPVQISCPLMKTNKDSYRDVLKYAQSKKIKAFSDYIMMGEADLSTGNLINRLSLAETEKVIREIIEYDVEYPRWIREKRPYLEKITKEQYQKQALCGVGLNNICISENGDLYPCPGWQSMIVGNIFSDSLANIWKKSEKLQNLRKITHSSFPKCMECEARKYCTMCLERNCNENNGNMFKVSQHFCDVAFLMKHLHEEYESKGML